MTPVERASFAAALCIAVSGCVTPPKSEQAAPAQPAAPPHAQAETEYRGRALALTAERRWPEALAQWEVLALMRPASGEYRDQAERARKQIADGVAQSLAAADQARKRGDLDRATSQYLRVLSLDPANSTAAEALREIERERTRRAYLSRPPRTTMGAAPTEPYNRGTTTNEALSDLDVGTMLLRQGDAAGAAQSFQRQLQRSPNDAQAKAGLAEASFQLASQYAQQGRNEDALVYFERARANGYPDRAALATAVARSRKSLGEEYYRLGVQAAVTDPKKAMFLWERSLYFDPGQKDASARLAEARRAAAPAAPATTAR
jgi:tetratricopeptide (TPR) repeat protein